MKSMYQTQALLEPRALRSLGVFVDGLRWSLRERTGRDAPNAQVIIGELLTGHAERLIRLNTTESFVKPEVMPPQRPIVDILPHAEALKVQAVYTHQYRTYLDRLGKHEKKDVYVPVSIYTLCSRLGAEWNVYRSIILGRFVEKATEWAEKKYFMQGFEEHCVKEDASRTRGASAAQLKRKRERAKKLYPEVEVLRKELAKLSSITAAKPGMSKTLVHSFTNARFVLAKLENRIVGETAEYDDDDSYQGYSW
jgi:hypothetical protein